MRHLADSSIPLLLSLLAGAAPASELVVTADAVPARYRLADRDRPNHPGLGEVTGTFRDNLALEVLWHQPWDILPRPFTLGVGLDAQHRSDPGIDLLAGGMRFEIGVETPPDPGWRLGAVVGYASGGLLVRRAGDGADYPSDRLAASSSLRVLVDLTWQAGPAPGISFWLRAGPEATWINDAWTRSGINGRQERLVASLGLGWRL
jgi:hypothetical protein